MASETALLSPVNASASNRETSAVVGGRDSAPKGPVFRAWACRRFSVASGKPPLHQPWPLSSHLMVVGLMRLVCFQGAWVSARYAVVSEF